MPAAVSELLLLPPRVGLLLDGTYEVLLETYWFGSDTFREWPEGCRRWTESVSLIGFVGVAMPLLGRLAGAAVLLTTLISRSSCELVESLELSTGDPLELPLAFISRGTRPVDILLDERLARPESTMSRSTSLPFNEEPAMSTWI